MGHQFNLRSGRGRKVQSEAGQEKHVDRNRKQFFQSWQWKKYTSENCLTSSENIMVHPLLKKFLTQEWQLVFIHAQSFDHRWRSHHSVFVWFLSQKKVHSFYSFKKKQEKPNIINWISIIPGPESPNSETAIVLVLQMSVIIFTPASLLESLLVCLFN